MLGTEVHVFLNILDPLSDEQKQRAWGPGCFSPWTFELSFNISSFYPYYRLPFSLGFPAGNPHYDPNFSAWDPL